MCPVDFLRKNAETPLYEHFLAGGAHCALTTNGEGLLEAARESFLPWNGSFPSAKFSVRLWVDESRRSLPFSWPKPYVRGLDHLVFAGFDETSSILADLHTCRVIGRFSGDLAADVPYCKTVVFPILLTIVGASVGVAELHCACVARNDEGVLLAGPSGAGKSTLALAFAQSGYGFLSDDRTFCSLSDAGPEAWGLASRFKLRAGALEWFPEFKDRPAPACDSAIWFDPEDIGFRRVCHCRAASLVFLERCGGQSFELSPVSKEEALRRLNAELMAELPEAEFKRSRTIQELVRIPCWLLKYGGSPQTIAQRLSRSLAAS